MERQKKEEEALVLAEEKFKEDKWINSNEYKGLLIKYGIWSEIPIKTRGWINDKLVDINLKSCRWKSPSKSVWDSLSMLKTALEITE